MERIKISASFDISSKFLGSAPISSANFDTPSFPLEFYTLTLYPALTNFLAIVPPIEPTPIKLIFILYKIIK